MMISFNWNQKRKWRGCRTSVNPELLIASSITYWLICQQMERQYSRVQVVCILAVTTKRSWNSHQLCDTILQDSKRVRLIKRCNLCHSFILLEKPLPFEATIRGSVQIGNCKYSIPRKPTSHLRSADLKDQVLSIPINWTTSSQLLAYTDGQTHLPCTFITVQQRVLWTQYSTSYLF